MRSMFGNMRITHSSVWNHTPAAPSLIPIGTIEQPAASIFLCQKLGVALES